MPGPPVMIHARTRFSPPEPGSAVSSGVGPQHAQQDRSSPVHNTPGRTGLVPVLVLWRHQHKSAGASASTGPGGPGPGWPPGSEPSRRARPRVAPWDLKQVKGVHVHVHGSHLQFSRRVIFNRSSQNKMKLLLRYQTPPPPTGLVSWTTAASFSRR